MLETDLSYPPANVRSPGGQGWQMDERAHGTEECPTGHTAQLLASPREEFCGSVTVDNFDICMYVRTYVCICTCVYIYIQMYVYIYIYLQVYIYIYINIYIHI